MRNRLEDPNVRIVLVLALVVATMRNETDKLWGNEYSEATDARDLMKAN